MNEKQAIAKGYHFTGNFSHDKEEQKKNALDIRVLGFGAMVINCPPDPLSRGHHGMGYSVYAEQKYFDHVRLCDLTACIARIPAYKAELKSNYERAIKELDDRETKCMEEINKLEEIFQ